MVSIKSTRLDMVFTGEIMPVRNGNETSFKFTYESLVNILDHQTPDEKTPAVEWNAVHVPNDAYPAWECVVSDGSKTICRYGAAPQESLRTKLDKLDPTACARRRAFSDAVAAFYEFDFSGCKEEDVTPPKPLIDNGVSVVDDVQEDNEDHGEVVYPDATSANEPVKAEKAKENTPIADTADANTTNKNNAETAHCGAVVVNFGKFKNAPKTVAEIYEEEVLKTKRDPKNWFYYMCENMKSQNYREIIDAMHQYRALMEP